MSTMNTMDMEQVLDLIADERVHDREGNWAILRLKHVILELNMKTGSMVVSNYNGETLYKEGYKW